MGKVLFRYHTRSGPPSGVSCGPRASIRVRVPDFLLQEFQKRFIVRGTGASGECHCASMANIATNVKSYSPARSSKVSITPVGSATPLPAMSKAQPCATEANSTGTPMVMAEARSGEINLIGMWPWSWNIAR